MKIVIELSEEDYNDITLTGKNTINLGVLLTLRKAVRNGIPLPKGHGALKDTDKIISDGISKGFCDWYDEIKYAETIIEADKAESEDKE